MFLHDLLQTLAGHVLPTGAAEMHCVSTSRYLPLRSSRPTPSLALIRTTSVVRYLCSLNRSSNHPSNPSTVRWYPPLFEAACGLGGRYRQQMNRSKKPPLSLHRCKRCPCLIRVSRSEWLAQSKEHTSSFVTERSTSPPCLHNCAANLFRRVNLPTNRRFSLSPPAQRCRNSVCLPIFLPIRTGSKILNNIQWSQQAGVRISPVWTELKFH